MKLPPPLRPGDAIAVVAPSSPFEHAPAWVGLGWLAQRYRVRFARGLFARHGYLAGDDERRLQELAAAFADGEVRAVLAARGGYGLSRIAHRIDWAAFAERPSWIVGFSDITALHVEAARAGVASLHAPNLTALGRGDARARQAWLTALEQPAQPRRFTGLSVLLPGEAQGPLFGGNLAILHACAAAGRLVVPEGAVMLLEDVTERPYRLDRMLSNLEVGGHLARASAFVLGDFFQCEPGADGVTAAEVLAERLGRLAVPVCAGLPVGHGRDNAPVVLGATARVDATCQHAVVTVGSS
jgi:muramoyltetrapeptide carboxypeptidase